MGYRVIEHFCDMRDNGYSYKVGDTYPRKDLSVSESRLKALATMDNALGRPLIKDEAEGIPTVTEETNETEEAQEVSTPKSRGRKKKD